jgi:hypothetical protein
MRLARPLATAGLIAAIALTPLAVASAATHHVVKPRFVVSQLGIVGHTSTYDVAKKAAVVRVRVQVKDHDKKFNPASVKLVVVEKVSGAVVDTAVVKARLVGRSRVVSNWLGTVTVPVGGVAPGTSATYCLTLVRVDDTSTATLPVLATAPGLAGRDCVVVTNSTKP